MIECNRVFLLSEILFWTEKFGNLNFEYQFKLSFSPNVSSIFRLEKGLSLFKNNTMKPNDWFKEYF